MSVPPLTGVESESFLELSAKWKRGQSKVIIVSISKHDKYLIMKFIDVSTSLLVLAGFPSSDAGTGDASSRSLLRSSCSSSLWPLLDLVYGVVGLCTHTKRIVSEYLITSWRQLGWLILQQTHHSDYTPLFGVLFLALLWGRCRGRRRGALPLLGAAGLLVSPLVRSGHLIS